MWTADVVMAMSVDGIDLAAPYRGTYSDAAGAADVIAEATGGGTLEDLMVMIAAQYTLPEVEPAFAWRGDIALFDTPLPEPPDPVDPTHLIRIRTIRPGRPIRRLTRAAAGATGRDERPGHGHRRAEWPDRRLRLAGWPGHGRYGNVRRCWRIAAGRPD